MHTVLGLDKQVAELHDLMRIQTLDDDLPGLLSLIHGRTGVRLSMDHGACNIALGR